jgi:hypothetical protein
MALAGLGAVAIWHDITAQGRDNFYAWHGNEHMLERVSIPGFLRGRRYVSTTGAPEFFNLYETESAETVRGAAYHERLNHPTAWTTKSVPDFRNVSRSLCTVVATFGRAEGGLVGTFRYSVRDGHDDDHQRYLTSELLPQLARSAGVAGCHLLRADQAASAVKTVEKNVRSEDNLIPPWIVLIEGWGDSEPFTDLCQAQLAKNEFTKAMLQHATLALYRLQATVAAGARG